jgi:hypothetical protein
MNHHLIVWGKKVKSVYYSSVVWFEYFFFSSTRRMEMSMIVKIIVNDLLIMNENLIKNKSIEHYLIVFA